MSETESRLAGIARQHGINLATATDAQKAKVYRLTVQAIEELLDTGDRTQLTVNSLDVIRKDILDILNGLRRINPASIHLVSAASASLRKARDKLDSARSYLEKGQRTDPYYDRLTKAQESLAEALTYF